MLRSRDAPQFPAGTYACTVICTVPVKLRKVVVHGDVTSATTCGHPQSFDSLSSFAHFENAGCGRAWPWYCGALGCFHKHHVAGWQPIPRRVQILGPGLLQYTTASLACMRSPVRWCHHAALHSIWNRFSSSSKFCHANDGSDGLPTVYTCCYVSRCCTQGR